MNLKNHFIKATEEYNTLENNVPSHYFRRTFYTEEKTPLKLTIAVCGFYELYFNGSKITRGFLSPYISNTNDFIYCDEYEITSDRGENVVGVLLGNGFQNNAGGHIWEFDKAPFRSAPMFSLTIHCGQETLLCSDTDFKTAPSPILFDDYRFGEYYDANYEIEGWNQKGFDDTIWNCALKATAPKGELRLANITPITKETEITPVKIIPCENGYIYDFGISNAGICRLNICGTKGQKIELQHADSLKDGDVDLALIWYTGDKWERDRHIVHKDTYICKGTGNEIYEPTFTYHGFRYVKVSGITEDQATKDLLTYLVYHTHLNTRGDFFCSDPITTTLQEITRRSVTSNFHHFPTDCPQREKNGWTADGALMCEATLINFDPERNYREWMRNIFKAQKEDGMLPGIVPTGGWGYHWGNGPAWDCVLAWIPYYTYIYRGETDMIIECSAAFLKYLRYLRSHCDKNGLLSIGLGDWCQVHTLKPKAPLIVTDSIISMDIAAKIATMLDAVNMTADADFARAEAAKYRDAIRANLIDFTSMTVSGECQSSQAMALYYGIFEQKEEADALYKLLEMIHICDDHMDVGVLGGRVIFHVLTRFGYSDLAYKMIAREDYPSYGNWVKQGATTLWEKFHPVSPSSMNHHFWGDISAWFIKCITGIQLNPKKNNVNELQIIPNFINTLDSAAAYHIAPAGKISVSWKRQEQAISLAVTIPEKISAVATLPSIYSFEDGTQIKEITTGIYRIVPKN